MCFLFGPGEDLTQDLVQEAFKQPTKKNLLGLLLKWKGVYKRAAGRNFCFLSCKCRHNKHSFFLLLKNEWGF